ncbi:MAG: hypothetical protein RLY86_749 [Pseudomonadota bacterium]|jgi:hypothetical protein
MDVFREVDRVLQALSSQGKHNRFPIRIDDIKDAICYCSNVDHVEFISVPETELGRYRNIVSGLVQIYEEQTAPYEGFATIARIITVENKDDSKRHFVVTKELCHLLFHGTPGSSVKTASDLVALARALALGPVALRQIGSNVPFATEQMAKLAAIEILFPFDERSKYKDQITHEDLHNISLKYRVPQEYLKIVLSEPYEAYRLAMRRSSGSSD